MSQGFVATGNISPSRIVIDDTSTAAGQVTQASSATSRPLLGVCQSGTHGLPLSIGGANLDDGFAATVGLNIAVFTVGDRCIIEAGGSFNPGDLLTSDGSGKGIVTTTDGNFYVGYALQAATAAGQLVEMRVQPGQRGS